MPSSASRNSQGCHFHIVSVVSWANVRRSASIGPILRLKLDTSVSPGALRKHQETNTFSGMQTSLRFSMSVMLQDGAY